jgi:hypothetical protein
MVSDDGHWVQTMYRAKIICEPETETETETEKRPEIEPTQNESQNRHPT